MKIVVSRSLPKAGMDLLKNTLLEIIINPRDRNLSYNELKDFVKDADGLISLLSDSIDKELIDSAPKLKAICNYAVGYNNIDVSYARSKGITVCNTPGVLTDATAELAWALLFGVTRRIPESDTFIRKSNFTGWEPELMLGRDISGKTLGIIGAGRIGTSFALKSQGFNMKILYTRSENPILNTTLNAKLVGIEYLLKHSDFISIHAPLTDETHHLITLRELEMMKPNAYLINISRGQLVKESDLVEALNNKLIAGAGLDVFEFEPEICQELLSMSNVVMAPHIGSATIATRDKMAIMAVKDMLFILEGNSPKNPIT